MTKPCQDKISALGAKWYLFEGMGDSPTLCHASGEVDDETRTIVAEIYYTDEGLLTSLSYAPISAPSEHLDLLYKVSADYYGPSWPASKRASEQT